MSREQIQTVLYALHAAQTIRSRLWLAHWRVARPDGFCPLGRGGYWNTSMEGIVFPQRRSPFCYVSPGGLGCGHAVEIEVEIIKTLKDSGRVEWESKERMLKFLPVRLSESALYPQQPLDMFSVLGSLKSEGALHLLWLRTSGGLVGTAKRPTVPTTSTSNCPEKRYTCFRKPWQLSASLPVFDGRRR